MRKCLEDRHQEAVIDSPIYSCAQNCSTPLDFPYDFYRKKSCNIGCCVNSMLPINKNMIVSQGLELILSMFRRTTMSGQHPLI